MLYIETIPADGDPAARKGQIFIETIPAVADSDENDDEDPSYPCCEHCTGHEKSDDHESPCLMPGCTAA